MDTPCEMIRVGRVADYPIPSRRTLRILTRYVGIFREADGSFRAIEMSCKHENADLSQGKIKGDIVTCPWHGWRYNLRTGECLWGAKTRLRPYQVEVRGEDLYISLHPLRD